MRDVLARVAGVEATVCLRVLKSLSFGVTAAACFTQVRSLTLCLKREICGGRWRLSDRV